MTMLAKGARGGELCKLPGMTYVDALPGGCCATGGLDCTWESVLHVVSGCRQDKGQLGKAFIAGGLRAVIMPEAEKHVREAWGTKVRMVYKHEMKAIRDIAS